MVALMGYNLLDALDVLDGEFELPEVHVHAITVDLHSGLNILSEIICNKACDWSISWPSDGMVQSKTRIHLLSKKRKKNRRFEQKL